MAVPAIKILNILKMTYKDYDDFRFTYFINYCIRYQEFGLPLQSMIKNDHLLTWFQDNWRGMVEAPFLKQIKDYDENEIVEPTVYLQILSTYADSIEKYYPKVIFKTIKNSLKPQTKTINE